jgi:NADP oxidoreductase coenzyme F420-dependent
MIGGGVMGEALLSRLIAVGVYKPDQILVSDPQAARREFLTQTYGIGTTDQNAVAATASEVLMLAIKPQIFPTVAADLFGKIASPDFGRNATKSARSGISPPACSAGDAQYARRRRRWRQRNFAWQQSRRLKPGPR